MAGVPVIFRAMVESARPMLTGGAPMLSWSFRVPMPEGEVAEPLRALAAAWPDVGFGSYPFFRGGLGTTLVARSADRPRLEAAAAALRAMLAGLGVEAAGETPPV
jgi:molybdopterin-biosynthesis enzyme MoeA-like protein